MARPTKYTQKIADTICERIADGESLRSVCASEKMPSKSTVLLWVVTDGEDKPHHGFSDQYIRAREAAGFSHADEALHLRHELRDGSIDPQSANVILKALQWGAERMSPKRHSQRQEHEHTSPDGSMTPQVQVYVPDNGRDG